RWRGHMKQRICAFLITRLHREALGFFFSSRRRHTRWPRDWSSDVCSSDLRAPEWTKGLAATQISFREWPLGQYIDWHPAPRRQRSEERREGKSVDLGGGRITKKKTRRSE